MSPAPVNRPQAWRIRPAEITRLAADGKHCETRRCDKPAVIVTWRWWRSAAAGRFLVAEHMVCEQHGAEFAERHHIGVDPAAQIEARRLADAEALSLALEGRHCAWPACRIPATWIFTQRYTVHGEPRADDDLSCEEHAGMFAAALHIGLPAEPGEGDAW
jgi:hypothetical protein